MCSADDDLMILLEDEARIERSLGEVKSELMAEESERKRKQGVKKRAGKELRRANNRFNVVKGRQTELFNAAHPAGARGDPVKHQEWRDYRYGEEYTQCESAMLEAQRNYRKAKQDVYLSDDIIADLNDKMKKLESEFDLASQRVLRRIYSLLRVDPDDQDVVDVLQRQLGIAGYRDVRIVFDPDVPVCNVLYAFDVISDEHAHIAFNEEGRVRYDRRPGQQHGAQNFADELRLKAKPAIVYIGGEEPDLLLMSNCQGCGRPSTQCAVERPRGLALAFA